MLKKRLISANFLFSTFSINFIIAFYAKIALFLAKLPQIVAVVGIIQKIRYQ